MTISAIVLVVLASGWRAPSAGSTGSPVGRSSLSARPAPLMVVAVPTPRFQVPRYDTRGTYPQVRDANLDLSAVNAGLRAAVILDQREYAPAARRNSVGTAREYHGLYKTSIDRRLLSASTVVVSALMPATKLYPGGNEGNTWVAVTVRVPSGRPVRITSLFADPSRGLRALASAWKTRVRRTNPRMWPCVRFHLADYRPGARRYRHFALTVQGLTVGFWQEPACNRLAATVPYTVLRPYLGKLGRRLIAGIRRPRVEPRS